MATNFNSNTNALTVKFVPTKAKYTSGPNKGQPTGMWLSLSKPFSLSDAGKNAIVDGITYQRERWGRQVVESPSLGFAKSSISKGATDNMYYLGNFGFYSRPEVQAAIMNILSNPASLKVTQHVERPKAVPQNAGAAYQILMGAQPQQYAAPQPQPQPQQQYVQPAPQIFQFSIPQQVTQPAPQPVEVVVPQPAKNWTRIG